MTAPTDKMLVYDGNCPLCDWYTGVFAEHDLLKPEHRRTFAMFADSELRTMMEFPRAKHEVPLVDLNGGPTLYGVEALAWLLGRRFPLVCRLMRYRFVAGIARVAYALVSYNRRFIAFSRPAPCSADYTPDFNSTYRSLFVVLCTLTAVLLALPFLLAVPAGGVLLLILYTALALLVCVALVYILRPHLFEEYTSHLAVILVLGSLPLGCSGILTFVLQRTGVWPGASPLLGVGAMLAAVLTTRLYHVRNAHIGMGLLWTVLWGVLALVLMALVILSIVR